MGGDVTTFAGCRQSRQSLDDATYLLSVSLKPSGGLRHVAIAPPPSLMREEFER